MKHNLRLIFGILFVTIGALIVLQNLNIFTGSTGNIIWAALFGAGGIFVFVLYFNRRENWWWLVIGLIALSFTASNLAALFSQSKPYSPLFALFGAGICFMSIYFIERRQWWVFIPGGILLSIGVDELLQVTSPDTTINGIIFFGMGIAFLLMFLIPSKEGRLNWAVLPAVVFLALGLISSFDQGNQALQITGPALLLLAGGAVLFYSFNKK